MQIKHAHSRQLLSPTQMGPGKVTQTLNFNTNRKIMVKSLPIGLSGPYHSDQGKQLWKSNPGKTRTLFLKGL